MMHLRPESYRFSKVNAPHLISLLRAHLDAVQAVVLVCVKTCLFAEISWSSNISLYRFADPRSAKNGSRALGDTK
jgi:hypothetical protein